MKSTERPEFARERPGGSKGMKGYPWPGGRDAEGRTGRMAPARSSRESRDSASLFQFISIVVSLAGHLAGYHLDRWGEWSPVSDSLKGGD